MPIGIDPNDTFSVKSSIDSHLPDEQRAVFKVRAISVYEERRIRRFLEEALAAKTLDEQNGKLNDALCVGVVGWENVPYPFSPEGLDKAFSATQKIDFIKEYPHLVAIGEIEKKASRSRQVLGAEKSANPAGAESVTMHRDQATV
jgi:hypothetical protein